jgi:hypothetical protein
MNNLQQSPNDLQIQIGEYLANIMFQIDNKLGTMIQALANMENNITHINTRLSHLESAIYNPNKRNSNGKTQYEDDSELKRKVSQARQDHELQTVLEKEKIKWEREQLERELLIEQAKISWENEKVMKEDKTNADMFSYLS